MHPSGNSSLRGEKRNGLEQWKFSLEVITASDAQAPRWELCPIHRGGGEVLPNNERGDEIGEEEEDVQHCM